MARITKPLTVSEIKKAKAKEKLYKLYDGQGLYLAVSPSGKKVWRFDYTDFNKKRQTHTIGDLDFISLEEARAERLKLREKLFRGKGIKSQSNITFEYVYTQWFENWSAKRAKTTANRAKSQIEKFFIPKIGNISIENITTKDVVNILYDIDKTGARELLNKTKSAVNLCFAYAISRGYISSNPVTQIDSSIFSKQVKSNNRHLHKTEIHLIHKLINRDNFSVTRLCFDFMIRNISRPQEAAGLLWSEYNKNDEIIMITEDRMKMRIPHALPISTQSIDILNFAKANFLNDHFVFPGAKPNTHIAIRSMWKQLEIDGIDSSSHGFRHLASTILNESRLFEADVIEAALSHRDTNTIRGTYNKAQYIEERRALLQWWSDFIDKCDTKENNERSLKEAGISLI